MIERAEINGRGAIVAYLDSRFNPVPTKDAELVKIIFDDGEVTFVVPAREEEQ